MWANVNNVSGETEATVSLSCLAYHHRHYHRQWHTPGRTSVCSRRACDVARRESSLTSTTAATASQSSRREPSACRQRRHVTMNSHDWRQRRRPTAASRDGTSCENWHWGTEILACVCCPRDHRLVTTKQATASKHRMNNIITRSRQQASTLLRNA